MMRELPVAIRISYVLMHVAAGCAFLLPVLPIDWKGRMAGIVIVHILAVCYWEAVSPWFVQRQIDEISSRVMEVGSLDGSSDSDVVSNQVKIAYIHVDMAPREHCTRRMSSWLWIVCGCCGCLRQDELDTFSWMRRPTGSRIDNRTSVP